MKVLIVLIFLTIISSSWADDLGKRETHSVLKCRLTLMENEKEHTFEGRMVNYSEVMIRSRNTFMRSPDTHKLFFSIFQPTLGRVTAEPEGVKLFRSSPQDC